MPISGSSWRRLWISAVGSVLMAAPAVLACQICIPFPQASTADYLIESEVVVLAREDPNRPFHFAPVKVLKGAPGDEPIDLFLDSSTRRILSVRPEASILLVRGGDDGNSGWRRIGRMDDAFGPIVNETLARAPEWKENPAARTAYFAKELGNKDSQIRTLAHLELAKAPYAEIRKYGDVLSTEEIHAFLDEIRYLEWHPLYIVLLAQSDQPEDHARIRESMESAARFDLTQNLAAWATALVEIDQEKGVEFLEKRYLLQADRNKEELGAIVAALSVQGTNGTEPLRDRIVNAYGAALDKHPELAPALVKDLQAWQRYDLTGQVARLTGARPPVFDFSTLLKLRAYASRKGSR